MKRLLLALLLSFSLCPRAEAVIAFDNIVQNGDVDSGASATFTQSFTIAAGANLTCWAFHDTHNTTSIVWNGTESLTSIQATVDDSGGGSMKAAMFMLHNPTSGTHNVVVTFAGTTGGTSRLLACMSFTGVESSTLAASHRAVTHGTTPISVASVSGDTVIATTMSLALTPGPVSAQTVRGAAFNAPGGTNNWTASGSTTAAGASTSMGFTGGIGFDTLIGIALIPASGGGGSTARPPCGLRLLGVGCDVEN